MEVRALLTGLFAASVGQITLNDHDMATPVVANIVDFFATSPSDFTVKTDWGDGTPSTTGIVVGGNGYFSAYGGGAPGHRYATDGVYTITVTISIGTDSAVVTDPAIVSEADLSGAGAGTINGSPGTALSATIATITDPGSDPAANYTVVVDWGDGHTNSSTDGKGLVTLTGSNGSFSVGGTHTYASDGSYPITTTVTENEPNLPGTPPSLTITNTTAVISGIQYTEPAPYLAGVGGFSMRLGQNVSNVLANFADVPSDPNEKYVVTIDWGDGTPLDTTSGTVLGVNGYGSVLGTHAYASSGTFTVTVTLTDQGAPPVSVKDQAMVF